MAAATICSAPPRSSPRPRSRIGSPRAACPGACAITAAPPRRAARPRASWYVLGSSPMATVRYLIRARDLPQLHALLRRVEKVAEGAALMTETQVRHQVISGDANLVGNTPLEQLMHRHVERLGPPPFDAADRAFAAEIQ